MHLDYFVSLQMSSSSSECSEPPLQPVIVVRMVVRQNWAFINSSQKVVK